MITYKKLFLVLAAVASLNLATNRCRGESDESTGERPDDSFLWGNSYGEDGQGFGQNEPDAWTNKGGDPSGDEKSDTPWDMPLEESKDF